jgi:hypothetical protein
MKASFLALALLAAAAPAAGQPAAGLPPVDPKVAQLRDSALKDDTAYGIVEGLTTEVGQRLAGTEAEARARDWAVRTLTALGFSNVRVEPFEIPLRTSRIVWFGSEEVGLFGGLDYQKRHGKEPHWAIAESDFGSDRIWKVDSKLGPAREAEGKALQSALAPLGIVPGALDDADGSDIGPMIAAGMPAVGLSQDGTYYFDVHHTPDDTLDKVDPETLRQNVAAWTAMLAVLSGGIEPEPKRAKRR